MNKEHNSEPTNKAIDALLHPEHRHNHFNVFVYGTLKRGCANHGAMWMPSEANFIRLGFYNRNKLMRVGRFPLIISTDNKDDIVAGEIYSVDAAFKDKLDEIENSYGYYASEISQGIICYYPRFFSQLDARDVKAVPKDKNGCYNWTVDFEQSLYEVPNVCEN